MARLTQPIDFKKLLTEGADYQFDVNDIRDNITIDEEDDIEGVLTGERPITDEDTYQGDIPFKTLAQSMNNLTKDGKIKKLILREGTGEPPEKMATVKVHYSGFHDETAVPFDSTHARNRPLKLVIGDGQAIPGLDFGIRSMKLNEKAQILIHPDYAFGKNCLGIPANAQVLFEVELLEIINDGAAKTYNKLPKDQQNQFEEIYKYCLALKEKGKQYFLSRDYEHAIIEYNTAAAKLEQCVVPTEEIERRRDLLLTLYTNLVICQGRKGDAHKGCKSAENIYNITQNGELMKIPAKVFYNHGKCLRILGEYEKAKVYYEKALKIEPKNHEIMNEMITLQCDCAKYEEMKKKFAKAFVGDA